MKKNQPFFNFCFFFKEFISFFTKDFEKTDIPASAQFLDQFFRSQLGELLFDDRIDDRFREIVQNSIQNAIAAELDLFLYTKEAENKIVAYLR